MKRKFHWGHGILIFLIVFLLFVALVIRYAMKQKINLVTPDYYNKELIYQQDINKLENTNRLSEKVTVEMMNDKILVQFPILDSSQYISGFLQVYRPSDYELDLNYELDLTENYRIMIPLDSLQKGVYDLIVDWKCDTVEYLQKERIHIH